MSNEIDRWICSGAEVTEGLRLLSIYAPNNWLEALVRKAPKAYSHLLKKALLPFSTEVPFSQTLTKGGRFREDWPFLAEPDCPTELKALAADMITSWHNYVNAHEDLFRCTTPEECFEVAAKTIRNFTQNPSSRLSVLQRASQGSGQASDLRFGEEDERASSVAYHKPVPEKEERSGFHLAGRAGNQARRPSGS